MDTCNYNPTHSNTPEWPGYRIVESCSIQLDTASYLVHWEEAEQYRHAHYGVQYPTQVNLPLKNNLIYNIANFNKYMNILYTRNKQNKIDMHIIVFSIQLK